MEVRVEEVLDLARWLGCLLDLCARPLRHILLQLLNAPATSVVFRQAISAIEPLESWESSNAVFRAQLLVSVAIDLRNRDLLVRGGEGVGELLPGRSELLAVAAPWGEELHKTGLAAEHYGVEVRGVELDDIGSRGDSREGE